MKYFGALAEVQGSLVGRRVNSLFGRRAPLQQTRIVNGGVPRRDQEGGLCSALSSSRCGSRAGLVSAPNWCAIGTASGARPRNAATDHVPQG